MMNYIQEIFKSLNVQNINYVVLRGYIPLEEITYSADIDIYVHPSDLKKTKNILKTIGFKTPYINACNYPHVQYFLLTSEQFLKIDIVTELCFGEALFSYVREGNLLQYIVQRDYIKTFRTDIALELFVLHIIFDKGELSITNCQRLFAFFKDCKEKKLSLNNLPTAIKHFCDLVIENVDINALNQEIRYLKETLVCEEGLLKVKPNKCRLQRRTRRNVKWRYRLNRLPRKSIALIGVDGSGKSTTVQALQKLLGSKCCVQYMGFREMETFWGEKYYASGKRFKFKFIPFLGIYFEMWYRYLKNRFNNYKVIFYDRFPWEAYDNGFGKYKVVYFILFKVLFPRPKKVYYLHCSVETSLDRKSDITDKELFINMKKRFDKKYKDKRNIRSFNTDDLTTTEIVNYICNDIMNNNFYEFLF